MNTARNLLTLTIIFLFISAGSLKAQLSAAGMAAAADVGFIGNCASVSKTGNNTGLTNYYGNTSGDLIYKFTLVTSAVINISHCNSVLGDTYLALFDKNGAFLDRDDDDGPLCEGLKASTQIALQPGVYYVVSEGYGSSQGQITTDISVNNSVIPPGTSLSNAIVINANPFTDTRFNSTADCYVNTRGDVSPDVYYKLSLNKDTRVTIAVCAQYFGSPFEGQVYLLNSAGAVLKWASFDGRQTCGTICFDQVVNAGAYYIMLDGFMGEFGSMPITVTQTPAWHLNLSTGYNFLLTSKVSVPGVKNSEDVETFHMPAVQHTVEYYDAMGKSWQKISVDGGLNGEDMTEVKHYDATGKLNWEYMQYPAAAGSGAYRTNGQSEVVTALTRFYPGEVFHSELQYESNPLNRKTGELPRGVNWIEHDRGVYTRYEVNVANEVWKWNISDAYGAVPQFAGYYDAGKLTRTVVVDENYHKKVTYKDFNDRVVLEKVQVSENADVTQQDGWLCTYSIYNDLGLLRYIITPAAVEKLKTYPGTAFDGATWSTSNLAKELCFSYEYDERDLAVVKRLQSSNETYLVYDKKKRIVMSQDGNQRANGQWLVFSYDGQNRLVKKSLINDANSRDYHAGFAVTSVSYPAVSDADLLVQTFYDNYDWSSAMSNNQFDAAEASSGFADQDDLSYPYPRKVAVSDRTVGLSTGSKVKLMDGTNTYLYSVLYYDGYGNLIQTKKQNMYGGQDKETNQYAFDGTLLTKKSTIASPALTPSSTSVITRNTFNRLHQPLTTTAQVDNNPVTNSVAFGYDQLLRQGERVYGSWLQDVIYDFNIRGWITSISKEIFEGSEDQDFGMKISYDDDPDAPQFNGNVSGIQWMGRGDMVQRRYLYAYDAADRLVKADYSEYTNGSWNKNSGLDFSVVLGNNNTATYDANGNISNFTQWGYKEAKSAIIDDLHYHYINGGNRLLNVQDGANDALTTFGDFRTSDLHPDKGNTTDQRLDYRYDKNDNLIQDLNKDIDDGNGGGITYSYLNKPEKVSFKGNSSIQFVYDANGAKLKKLVTDAASGVTKTTCYSGGFMYENGVLTEISTAEGRIRRTADGAYVNDYFVKDHLGSTRSVITDEQSTDFSVPATVEGDINDASSAVALEQGTFDIQQGNIANTDVIAGIPWHRNENSSAPNNSGRMGDDVSHRMYVLNGSGGSQSGLGAAVKVMAGDRVSLYGMSYYADQTPDFSNQTPLSILTGLLGAPGIGSAAHGASPQTLLGLGNNLSDLSGYVSNLPSKGSIPRAYVNYVFFDEQLHFVSGGSSQVQTDPVLNGTTAKDHYEDDLSTNDIPVNKSGYLYVYCSNESPVNVYFDNLQVGITHGRLMQETHYYPFGLTNTTLSSGVPGKHNNHLYSGKELNHKEFSDGRGLELYDFDARMQDPQLGRWSSMDPESEKYAGWSPYNYAINNPMRFVDKSGKTVDDWIYLGGSNTAANYVYNSRVNNAATAIYLYGPDASFIAKGNYGGERVLEGGAKMQLMEKGQYSINGAIYKAADQANVPMATQWDFDGNGKLSLSEANKWRRNADGQPIVVDASKITLGELGPEFYDNGQNSHPKNLFFDQRTGYDGLVYGTLDLTHAGGNKFQIAPNAYDFDIGAAKGHPWDSPSHYIRNVATILAWINSGVTGTDYMIFFNGYATPGQTGVMTQQSLNYGLH